MFQKVFAGGSAARVLALVMALALVLPGPPATAQSYSFSNVTIQGNQRVEPATILTYAGIGRGQSVSAAQLNDAYQRLINSGLFQAVELVPQGGTLVIRVTENPTINRINIEGNRRINDDDLLAAVGSQPRRIYSPAQAETDAAAIVGIYQNRGRLAATVTPKIIRRSENRVDLVFEVIEGRVVEIERLGFVGNQSFSDRRLRRVLGTKQAGLFRQLIRRDSYDEARIEFDKQVLRDFYLSRGYIDFQTRSVSSEFSRERNAFFITFAVDEGQQYRFGRTSVSSEVEGVDATGFRNLVRIRQGATYSPSAVDAAIARMEGQALRQGLTFVRVDPRVTRNEASGTLDIDFVIVRGPRIFVERIDIEGNATTLDRVIRTQFRTVEGDPFNPREIREAAERIRFLGFFSNADVQARQGSGPDQVIVDVDVEEQNTGSLSFGASYGADAGIGFSLIFSESNFLGRGQGLRFELTTTSDSRAFVFDFTEPNVLGRNLTLRLPFNYRETENYNSDFSSRVGTFSPGVEFPVSEYGRLGVRANLGYGAVFDVDDGDADDDGFNDGDTNENGVEDPGETFTSGSSAILRAEEARGGQFRGGFGLTYTYDTRRDGIDPLGGMLFRLGADVYAGDSQFLKTTATVAGERRIWNEEVTLRASLEGGALHNFGGDTSLIIDRFLLGSQQFRGFAYGGIGPRDLNVTNRDALGGKYYAVARFEAEFPIGLPEEYGVNGGLFMDVGSLWGLDDTAGGPAGADPVDDGFHLRSSIGVSLFWNTPIGPLRFNFSRPLQKQDYDETQSFDISISTRF